MPFRDEDLSNVPAVDGEAPAPSASIARSEQAPPPRAEAFDLGKLNLAAAIEKPDEARRRANAPLVLGGTFRAGDFGRVESDQPDLVERRVPDVPAPYDDRVPVSDVNLIPLNRRGLSRHGQRAGQ
jgi:hypothetical protein